MTYKTDAAPGILADLGYNIQNSNKIPTILTQTYRQIPGIDDKGIKGCRHTLKAHTLIQASAN